MDGEGVAGEVEHRQRVRQGEQLVYRGVGGVCDEGPCIRKRYVDSGEKEERSHPAQMQFVVRCPPGKQHLEGLVKEDRVDPCVHSMVNRFEFQREWDRQTIYQRIYLKILSGHSYV